MSHNSNAAGHVPERRRSSPRRAGEGHSSSRRAAPAMVRRRLRLPQVKANRPFWLLAALLILAFLMGGSSRGDVASFVILRPAACLIGSIGLLSLRKERIWAYRWLFVLALAALVLICLQLLPLSHGIFEALPGRGIIQQVDQLAGLTQGSRPMTIAPLATLNALWSLIVPIVALILVVQLEDSEHKQLLALLLLLGAASALLAMVQITSDPNGPLYFYEMARGDGNATGFFANKNHQAVFLASLIPVLMAFRDMRLRRMKDREKVRLVRIAVIGLLVGFVPLLLVTNSRAGLMAGIVGLFGGLTLLGSGTRERGAARLWSVLALIGGAGAIWLVTQYAQRALAWNRLVELNPVDDLRYKILPLVKEGIASFMPWGAGAGSFRTLYILKEPDSLVSTIIMQQVHDDWLDVPVAFGVPGILLVLALMVGVIVSGVRVLRARERSARLDCARVGVLGVLILGIGSLTDYPLRTEALAAIFVIFMVWVVRGASRTSLSHVSDHSLFLTSID